MIICLEKTFKIAYIQFAAVVMILNAKLISSFTVPVCIVQDKSSSIK